MNKLEELSNIQDQQIDAVLITPNDSNLDSVSASQQSVSNPTASQMSNVNVNQAASSSLMSVTAVTTASHSSHIAPVTNSSDSIPPVLVPGMNKSSASAIKHDSVTDFKPTTSLPDVVEVKTGEEVKKILFENRVKLYFFPYF